MSTPDMFLLASVITGIVLGHGAIEVTPEKKLIFNWWLLGVGMFYTTLLREGFRLYLKLGVLN